MQEQIIITIYNISRHDDGAKHLNTLNASEIIRRFQNNDHDNNTTNNACIMALVLLSTPEQIKNDDKYMDHILDALCELMYETTISSFHRTKVGLHLSELLIVFVKLFNDDRVLDYIMDHSQVNLHTSSNTEFFINLLIDYHSTVSDEDPLKQTTCTALVNIL